MKSQYGFITGKLYFKNLYAECMKVDKELRGDPVRLSKFFWPGPSVKAVKKISF